MKEQLFICQDCGNEFKHFERSFKEKMRLNNIVPWIVLVLSEWFIPMHNTSIKCPKCKSNNIKKL